jgi:hypothetical protein
MDNENTNLPIELKFNEETHVYTLGDKDLISVTQLLEKQKISPSYTAVDPELLKRAAMRGTAIHKEIEEYNKTGEIGFTPECQAYADYVEDMKLHCIASECQVYTDYYAGTFDQLLETEDGELILSDNKTTSQIHRESVSWQLSLYAYAYWVMTGVEIAHGQVFWFKKDGTLEVRDIPLKDRKEVEELISADKRGEIYKSPYPVEIAKIAYVEGLKARKDELEAQVKEIAAEIETYQDEFIQAMTESGRESFDTGYAKFTVVHSKKSGKFDDKKFKEDHPDEYEKYFVMGEAKKDTLRITLRK